MRDSETKSKTILAKILSQENLTVQIVSARQASFNITSRILSIPEMKGDLPDFLYNMYVGHEVAHALETPSSSWYTAPAKYGLSQSLLNIVEDVRVERIIQEDYPGLRRDFILAYKELLKRNAFGIRGLDVNKLHFLDRLNIRAKCGVSLGITFTASEQPLVDRVFATKTWGDVIAVSIDISKFLKEQRKDEPKMPKPKPSKEDDKGEPNDDGDETGAEDEGDPDDDGDKIGTEDEGEPDYDSEPDDENEDADKTPKRSGSGREENDEPITDDALERGKQMLLESEKSQHNIQVNIPKIDYKKYIIPHKEVASILSSEIFMESEDWDQNRGNYTDPDVNVINVFLPAHKQQLFLEYQRNNEAMIKYMVKEFALKQNAKMIKRTTVAKTGVISGKRLFSYQYNDDIFLRNNVVREGKSHGMVIYLDWSGSMTYNLLHSLHQLFCLLDFCRKVQIPFEVYAFNSFANNAFMDEKYDLTFASENDVAIAGTFQLLQFFTHTMTSNEYTMMQKNLLLLAKYRYPKIAQMVMGGTPLNEAIVCAMDMIPDFRFRNKLQIVNSIFITDGGSNPLMITHESDAVAVYSGNKVFIEDEYRNVVVSKEGKDITEKLLEMLRIKTGSNVVGFFLTEWSDTIVDMVVGQTKPSILADFNNLGSVISINSGYDEYYLINSSKLEIKPESKKAQTISEILRQNKKTIQNRIILNRFIDLISKRPK